MASIAGSKGGTNLQALKPAVDKQPWIVDCARPSASELLNAQNRIKELEGLLAGGIEEVAKLLKENQRLETELEAAQNKLNAYKKYYEHEKPIADKICCNREKAMAVHSMPSTPE